jgi:hypothetical protein
MFLHEIASPCDIITEESKFGYSEHIKLAKKIIGFGSLQSQIYVKKNANKNKTALPTIATIYQKNDILIKTKNHRRKKSNEINLSNDNNNNSNNDTQSSSNSFHSNSPNEYNSINEINDGINKELSFNSILNEESLNSLNNNNIFQAKNKSRFDFANNTKELNANDKNFVPKIYKDIIDELSLRISFFMPLNKYIPIKNLEIDFCNNIYEKTKDEDLKNIITNSI